MCGICLVLINLPYEARSCLLNMLKIPPSHQIVTTAYNNINHRIDNHNSFHSELIASCVSAIASRGPTCPFGKIILPVTNENNTQSENSTNKQLQITLYASVLHLRGDTPTLQPLGYPSTNSTVWIAWNGEVFGGNVYNICQRTKKKSDTHIICELLYDYQQKYKSGVFNTLIDFENRVMQDILEQIEGPFSIMIYFDSPINQIWFGRDKLGRRSLCLGYTQHEDDPIVITSTGPPDYRCMHTVSIPVGGMFVIRFEQITNCNALNGHLNSVTSKFIPWNTPPKFLLPQFLTATSLPHRIGSSIENVVTILEQLLLKSVSKRINDYTLGSSSSIALMFSGGLDSGILAALILKVLSPSQELDLINVCFGKPLEAPDRFTGMATYKELQQYMNSSVTVRFICADIKKEEFKKYEECLLSLLCPNLTHMDVNIGAPLFFASRGSGAVLQSNFSENENLKWWNHYVKDNIVKNSVIEKAKPPPIQLLSGEESQICSHCSLVRKQGCTTFSCRSCCRRICQEQEHSRCAAHRHPVLNDSMKLVNNNSSELAPMYPPTCLYVQHEVSLSKSEEQMNGNCECPCCPTTAQSTILHYQAPSKIMLVGHGADELFAGYGRHSTAVRHRGVSAIKEEIVKDLERLWERNLGRDDRCISFWGREARHPFLDEEIIDFVSKLPPDVLVSSKEDKPLLRQLARRLNLHQCAHFKKRAIQFGTRSARQTNLDHFSSHRKAKGTEHYCIEHPE